MKKLLFSFMAVISLQFAFAQTAPADTVAVKYYLAPAKDYKEDELPKFNAFVKVNGKKYDLKTEVMTLTEKGDVDPTMQYNKKAKRMEYLLNTWFAGGGVNLKAFVTGSKAAKNRSVVVYCQYLDEQSGDSKWNW